MLISNRLRATRLDESKAYYSSSGRGEDPQELVETLQQVHFLWNTSRFNTARIVYYDPGGLRPVWATISRKVWKRAFSVRVLGSEF